MALTTTTALSYYQVESSTISEWPNPITFSLDALNVDDIEVCVIDTNPLIAQPILSLIKGVDYNIDFAAKTVTCTSAAWSDLSKITSHSADQLRIFRATSTTELVDFTNGAVLNADDLNLAYKQNLFATQEMNEDAALTRGGVQNISTAQLADSAVGTTQIANNAVDQNKLADDAVSTAKIQASAVNASRLATDAVETAKIQNNAVDVNKLADNAVETVKIKDDAVTYAKVAPASKAQMEGQSAAGVVTPDVLKNSPLVPKCYGSVTYDGGSPSVAAGSYNVQSVANTSTTQRTITFNTALSDANYFVLVTGTSPSAVTNFYATVIQKSTSGFVIDAAVTNEADYLNFDFVVFGSTYPNP